MRKIAAVFAALFITLALSAQNYKLTLRLQDAESGEPVGFATVSVTPEKGQHQYTLSDSEGRASIEKLRPGNYVLKAELLGYLPFEKRIEIKENLNLGVVKMETDRQVLDAAQVTALGNPVVIKKDTVEYNASSFKISDDNMLVDLLKKLPGIEVSEDGTITSNGETITKITIEGKTFFLDDPQLASQNIPAKLVEKVKVVKKKSEQAAFTGIDDGEDETVIDLSVKPGMMNGAFGNAMAGGGHDIPSKASAPNDWRWQAAFMGGRFTTDSQISIIANANNTNNRGFNDMAGSMMNSMMGGGGGMGRRGGGGGGWDGNSNGITTSWMGGINGNWDLFDKKMELGANYLYNGSVVDVTEDTYKETYMKDGSTLVSNNSGLGHTFTDGHRFGMRLEHKFSENTSILFQPQFNFGRGTFVQQTEFDSYTFGPGIDFKELDEATYKSYITNKGFTNNSGNNNNWQTRGFLLLRQRLGMPGRTISANIDWNLSNNVMHGVNQSLTTAYTGGVPGAPVAVNQRYDQSSISRSVGGRLVYTEPLGGDFYLEGSYTVRYSRSESERLTYDSSDAATADYTVSPWADWALGGGMLPYLNPGDKNNPYSNNIINWSLNHNLGLAFMYQNEALRAQLGAAAIPTRTYNETFNHSSGQLVIYDPKTQWNFAPRAMLFYDFNDNSNIRLFYFGRSNQPSVSQLNPVLDNSNPLSMTLGNPYLNPYFSHRMRSELELSNRQTFFTLRVNLDGSMVQDPITNASWYDATGRVFSFPINGHNSFNGNLRVMLNTPIGRSPFSISNMMRVSYSKSGSYVAGVLPSMNQFIVTDAKGNITDFKYKEFHDAYFVDCTEDWEKDFQDNTTRSLNLVERLRVTFRSEDVEVMASARTRIAKPWYTVQESVAATFNNQLQGSFKWTIGRSGVELSTDADYNWYNGYTTPQQPELVWNASVSMPLFRRQATLSLKAYDLLDQAKNLMVTTTDNYYQETRNNTLGRYVMLSFTWRFGNFGKAGEQMRSRMGGGPPRGMRPF